MSPSRVEEERKMVTTKTMMTIVVNLIRLLNLLLLGNLSNISSHVFRFATVDLTVGTWYAMDQTALLSVRVKPLAGL